MPDCPPAVLAAAESAIRDELKSSREVEPDRLARAALEAVAPLLAEAWGVTDAAMRWLIDARYEVIAGSRKADGAQGFFAALEHLDLYEPEEFYGDTLPEAIRRAHAWAVAKERENASSSSAATGEDGEP